MKRKFILTALWVLGIIALAARAEFTLERSGWFMDNAIPVLLGPVIEETLKLIAMRFTRAPVAIGLGFQVAEALLKQSAARLVMTPHWFLALPYAAGGTRWRWLPLAIAGHALWNAYVFFDYPLDQVLLVPLAMVTGAALLLLGRLSKANVELD